VPWSRAAGATPFRRARGQGVPLPRESVLPTSLWARVRRARERRRSLSAETGQTTSRTVAEDAVVAVVLAGGCTGWVDLPGRSWVGGAPGALSGLESKVEGANQLRLSPGMVSLALSGQVSGARIGVAFAALTQGRESGGEEQARPPRAESTGASPQTLGQPSVAKPVLVRELGLATLGLLCETASGGGLGTGGSAVPVVPRSRRARR
jgi:hypothetical protein